MESNFSLIKKYMKEGIKPDSDFKSKVLPLSEEFIKISTFKVKNK
jgi:hypothetical protein